MEIVAIQKLKLSKLSPREWVDVIISSYGSVAKHLLVMQVYLSASRAATSQEYIVDQGSDEVKDEVKDSLKQSML